VPLLCSTWPAVPVTPDAAKVLLKSMVVNFADDAVLAPMVVLSMVPALMSAVSAIRLSMLAVPSMYKLRHSWPTRPKSYVLSVAGSKSEFTTPDKIDGVAVAAAQRGVVFNCQRGKPARVGGRVANGRGAGQIQGATQSQIAAAGNRAGQCDAGHRTRTANRRYCANRRRCPGRNTASQGQYLAI
jgi:hypothetical protein